MLIRFIIHHLTIRGLGIRSRQWAERILLQLGKTSSQLCNKRIQSHHSKGSRGSVEK